MATNGHCSNIHICLAGNNIFQNELFVQNLKEIHNCQCTFTVVEQIHDLRTRDTHKKTIIYIDCHNKTRIEIISQLKSMRPVLHEGCTLGLFNVSANNGIEKLAFNFGVRSFFYPGNSAEDFCKGTRATLRGEVWAPRKIISEFILAHSGTSVKNTQTKLALTFREKEILSVLLTGATNKAIAQKLYISPHTVRTHLYRLYRKINVSSRYEAIMWAKDNPHDT